MLKADLGIYYLCLISVTWILSLFKIDPQTGRLAFDREFALVDTSGSAMRLHSYTQMSQVCTSIDLSTNVMTVSAPNQKNLTLSLDSESETVKDIQVCGTLCKGSIYGGSKASRWFSSVLGVRCWLARHHGNNDNKNEQENNGYAYYNEASILLVSQQSISYLNTVISAQGGKLVESRQFRPNIVVVRSCNEEEGNTEEEEVTNPEDSWEKIIIEGMLGDVVELKSVGKCARCQMVDVDPSSGMKGNILRALAQYRRERGKINFGTFFAGNPNAPEGKVWLEEGSRVRSAAFQIHQ